MFKKEACQWLLRLGVAHSQPPTLDDFGMMSCPLVSGKGSHDRESHVVHASLLCLQCANYPVFFFFFFYFLSPIFQVISRMKMCKELKVKQVLLGRLFSNSGRKSGMLLNVLN